MEKRRIAGLLLIIYGCGIITVYTFLVLGHVAVYLYFIAYIVLTSLFLVAGILIVLSGADNRSWRIAGIFLTLVGGILFARSIICFTNFLGMTDISIILTLLAYCTNGLLIMSGVVFIVLLSETKTRVAGIMLLLFGIVNLLDMLVYAFGVTHIPPPTETEQFLSLLYNLATRSFHVFVIVAGAHIKSTNPPTR